MDLKNEFHDLNLDDNIMPDEKLVEENLPEKKEDFEEGEKIIKDLEKRLAEIKQNDSTQAEFLDQEQDQEGEEEDEDDGSVPGEMTFYEKVQPFILPIALTFFAIIFAALFLYFFSKSRINNAVNAITNSGAVEQVIIPAEPVKIVIVPEKLTCEPPQFLNETEDECLDPEPEPEPEPEPIAKPGFENGTTTIVNVRFSFDKYNYDNPPRGIYVKGEQIFVGDYENWKINPANRAFANDHFFGVDRYTVSLIGDCKYVVDNAKILVSNMYERQNFFTGNVVRVVTASKPRVQCD